MADIVNLNRARKDRAKIDDRARAVANRLAHGRTKSERAALKTENDRATRLLDGAKLTPDREA